AVAAVVAAREPRDALEGVIAGHVAQADEDLAAHLGVLVLDERTRQLHDLARRALLERAHREDPEPRVGVREGRLEVLAAVLEAADEPEGPRALNRVLASRDLAQHGQRRIALLDRLQDREAPRRETRRRQRGGEAL